MPSDARLRFLRMLEGIRDGAGAEANAALASGRRPTDPDTWSMDDASGFDASFARSTVVGDAINRWLRTLEADDGMPDELLVQVLRARLHRFTYKEQWCALVKAAGGPRISASWLHRFLDEGLMGSTEGGLRRRDVERVRAALKAQDAHARQQLPRSLWS